MSTMTSNEEVATNIGANLRRILEEKGWSQIQLSRETGDPHMTIVNAIRGQHNPSAALVGRMAEALGVTTDELIAPPPSPRRKKRKSA